jgi:DNA primase catalytic subunit
MVEVKKEEGISPKEERIRLIAPIYYSRNDIKKAIYNFSKNREIVPRYFEGFGKRPDSLQYDSDITSLVAKGATSFHCSEELWKDPLSISTDLSEEQMKELREGWDLLIDIDCKYLEYSKMAAYSIIKALEFHGVKNVGCKYSGSKGFHIIVPWSAFPKQVYGQETKNMFPQFPRMICQYLTEVARPILEKEIEEEDIKFTSKLDNGVMCVKCKKMAEDIIKVVLQCPICKREESSEMVGEVKIKKCPDCRKEMIEKDKRAFHRCGNCRINSLTQPDNFRSSIDIFKVLGVDVVLVSPRHLFRSPYSLHEKTALASVVIDKNSVRTFQVTDANPLKVTVKEFLPDAGEDEAKELLMQAIDWDRSRKQEKEEKEDKNKNEGDNKGYKEVVIKDLTPNLYPPCISAIMGGVKEDGRKRALFILMNFFKSLKLDNKEIEKRVEEWDKKNYKSLKEGYIQSQLSWHERQKAMLPPNCDKPHYKDLAVCKPDNFCRYVKNPVNYTIRKSFLLRKNEGKEKSTSKRKD